ncbi:MAG: aspartate aminotransferase family protein, partial [Pseudomonadota bacterium]|nr:aspartate aminotransferase family protein [Pseudomonadota bacterium]
GGICRDFCFRNNLVMRAVRDSMVCSPPLPIADDEIDLLVERAWAALDQTAAAVADKMA